MSFQNFVKNKIPTISVCLIVKNEEAVIERLISSVACFSDEIIIVDTGSTDTTIKILKSHCVNYFEFDWCDDFSLARNYSYSKATCDYVMWLDADDIVTPENGKKIKELINSKDFDVAYCAYGEEYNPEEPFDGGVKLRDRIVKRSLNTQWMYKIHECQDLSNAKNVILCPEIIIYHDKLKINENNRNIRIFNEWIHEKCYLNDKNKSYLCRELCSHSYYYEAIKTYESITKDNYSCLDYALFFYSTSMIALGKYKELLSELNRLCKHDKESELKLCKIADCYNVMNNYKMAIEYYNRAINLDFSILDKRLHFRYFSEFYPQIKLCELYLELKEYDLAYNHFQKAEKLYPDCIDVLIKRIVFLDIFSDNSKFKKLRQPKSISVCMIVKNEEDVLERCLNGVKQFADEIIIVDTGSTDNTVSIARKFTKNIYDYEWCDDFAAARNFSFDKATCDYIMWLDADDIISEISAKQINRLKCQITSHNTIYAPYNVTSMKTSYNHLRIIKNDDSYHWVGKIHERLVLKCSSFKVVNMTADFVVLHDKLHDYDINRNLRIIKTLSDDDYYCFWFCVQIYHDLMLAYSANKVTKNEIREINKLAIKKFDQEKHSQFSKFNLVDVNEVPKKIQSKIKNEDELLINSKIHNNVCSLIFVLRALVARGLKININDWEEVLNHSDCAPYLFDAELDF